MPELEDDAVLQELINTFDAVVVCTSTPTHFQGALEMRVRLGETDYRLPPIFLYAPVHKAQLEQVRADQFARELARMNRTDMTTTGALAAQHESELFMGWVRRCLKRELDKLKGVA